MHRSTMTVSRHCYYDARESDEAVWEEIHLTEPAVSNRSLLHGLEMFLVHVTAARSILHDMAVVGPHEMQKKLMLQEVSAD